jgi:hypothetical protein
MQLPRPRFTVRRMMVAVAILGLSLGFLAERRARFLRVAAQHKSQTDWPWAFHLPPGVVSYDIEMQLKYERAARYPWLPVEPDPPRPKRWHLVGPEPPERPPDPEGSLEPLPRPWPSIEADPPEPK